MKTFHDHETAGHPGKIVTYNAVRQHYWWLGLRTFVKNYVQGCGTANNSKSTDLRQNLPTYPPKERNHSGPLQTALWI